MRSNLFQTLRSEKAGRRPGSPFLGKVFGTVTQLTDGGVTEKWMVNFFRSCSTGTAHREY